MTALWAVSVACEHGAGPLDISDAYQVAGITSKSTQPGLQGAARKEPPSSKRWRLTHDLAVDDYADESAVLPMYSSGFASKSLRHSSEQKK